MLDTLEKITIVCKNFDIPEESRLVDYLDDVAALATRYTVEQVQNIIGILK